MNEAGGDEKVPAVPMPKLTKRYAHVMNYADLPEITLQQMRHFFEHYKDLEPGKWVKVLGWGDASGSEAHDHGGDRKGEEVARVSGCFRPGREDCRTHCSSAQPGRQFAAFQNFSFRWRTPQRHDGLAHRLWRDMDQTSQPLLQFEDHPNRARNSERAERQGDG